MSLINKFEVNGTSVDILLDENKLNLRNYLFNGDYIKSKRYIDSGYFDFIYDVSFNNIPIIENAWYFIGTIDKNAKTLVLYIKDVETSSNVLSKYPFGVYKEYEQYTLMYNISTYSFILVNWNEYKLDYKIQNSSITEGIALNPKLFIQELNNKNNRNIIYSDEVLEPVETIEEKYINKSGLIIDTTSESTSVATYNVSECKKYSLSCNESYLSAAELFKFYDENNNAISTYQFNQKISYTTYIDNLILYAPKNSVILKITYNNTNPIFLKEVKSEYYVKDIQLNEINTLYETDEELIFTNEYQIHQLTNYIRKGSIVYLSGDVNVITCRTNAADETYYHITNECIAPIDIYYVKNATILGNLHIKSIFITSKEHSLIQLSNNSIKYEELLSKDIIEDSLININGNIQSSVAVYKINVAIYELPSNISTLKIDLFSGPVGTSVYKFYDANDNIIYDDNNIKPIDHLYQHYVEELSIPNDAIYIKLSYANTQMCSVKYNEYATLLSYVNNHKSLDYKKSASISYTHTSKYALRPLKILGCGNSWTNNATLYLGSILDSLGINVEINVSYAGSASFESYYKSIINNTNNYTHRKWTKETSWITLENCTYKQILEADNYDIITHQQVSRLSGNYTTYQPYLNNIIKFEKDILDITPVYFMHATWAYPDGTDSTDFENLYNNDTNVMYNSILSAYNQAMIDENIFNVIPVTPAIQLARELGIPNIDTTDKLHLQQNGCFIAACVWAEMLLRYYFDLNSISNKSIIDSTYTINSLSDEQITQIKQLSKTIVENIHTYFPNQRTLSYF